MIVNDDSSIINQLGASLVDDARVIIYERHMFIVQATEFQNPRSFGINRQLYNDQHDRTCCGNFKVESCPAILLNL
jgi:hypothetical protein